MTMPEPGPAPGDRSADVEAAILAEARNEVGAADHKASMVLALLGIGFGALLAGLIAREWSPKDLPGSAEPVWWLGATLAAASVAAAAGAVWPRFTVPPRTDDVYYWGHVAAFSSREALEQTLDDHPPTMPARTRHQMFELSRIVARKYFWVRVAMRLAAGSAPVLLLSAVIDY